MESLSKRQVFIGLYLFVLATFFVVTNSDSTSPFINPYTRPIDSNIFQYMGYIMTKGKVPYTDYFDHKGLLLYLFNALGILLSKTWGVHFLQCIYMTFVLLVWYKGLVMIKNQVIRLTIMPLSLVCLYHCYSLGNLTEDWSLLFISIPLMLYFRRIEKKETNFSDKELLTIGLSMGCLTMIRLNNVFPVVGMIVYCSFIAIKEKQYRYLYKSFCLVTAGCLIPIILGLTYMYFIGGIQGVKDMYYCNITFNLQYREHYGLAYNTEWLKFIYKSILPVPFLMLPFVTQNKYRMPLLLGFIFTFITLGQALFFHYLIVFLPLVVYSIGALRSKWRFVLMGLLILFNIKTLYNQILGEPEFKPKSESATEFGKLLSHIPYQYRDNVWVYNGAYMLPDLIENNLVQCNRVFDDSRIDWTKELKESETNKICRVSPKYVIFPVYAEDWMNRHTAYEGIDKDKRFISENYSVISSVTYSDGTKVFCYKLNE